MTGTWRGTAFQRFKLYFELLAVIPCRASDQHSSARSKGRAHVERFGSASFDAPSGPLFWSSLRRGAQRWEGKCALSAETLRDPHCRTCCVFS